MLQKTGKESTLLLPSPADPCTSAANVCVQHYVMRSILHRVAAQGMLTLVDANRVLKNANYNGRQH